MNSEVDKYLADGCGRCKHYQTPQCKVNSWRHILQVLRTVVIECGLVEEYKWSQPCYTLNGKNVLIVTAFKHYAALAFFKGALLKDIRGLLLSPGISSQSARQLRFTTVEEVLALDLSSGPTSKSPWPSKQRE